MSETTWTPGPWETDGTTVYVLGRDGFNRFWANVQKQRRDVTFAEMEANAALMSAAPDLYEALAEVECALWLLAAGGSRDAAEKHARTLAALAKARGETP